MLIDLGYVNGLFILPKLGRVVVPDMVLVECDGFPDQPGLVLEIIKAGIVRQNVSPADLKEMGRYKKASVSWPDVSCFYFARKNSGIVLSNEKALRKLCEANGVECRGTIWVLERAYQENIVSGDFIRKAVAILQDPNLGRRLPVGELEKLMDTISE